MHCRVKTLKLFGQSQLPRTYGFYGYADFFCCNFDFLANLKVRGARDCGRNSYSQAIAPLLNCQSCSFSHDLTHQMFKRV